MSGKSSAKIQIGCPYCSSSRIGEESAWDVKGDRKIKLVVYDCGTSLELNKIGNRFQNNRYTRRCNLEMRA